jgi:hypothetical protein
VRLASGATNSRIIRYCLVLPNWFARPGALGRSVITLDTVKARIAVVDRHAD